jgi:hypothetical protein
MFYAKTIAQFHEDVIPKSYLFFLGIELWAPSMLQNRASR